MRILAPIRGILNENRGQIVFIDTPGLHKPRSLMGQRLNDSAVSAIDDVDIVVSVVDASADIGKGDTYVLEKTPGFRYTRKL